MGLAAGHKRQGDAAGDHGVQEWKEEHQREGLSGRNDSAVDYGDTAVKERIHSHGCFPPLSSI